MSDKTKDRLKRSQEFWAAMKSAKKGFDPLTKGDTDEIADFIRDAGVKSTAKKLTINEETDATQEPVVKEREVKVEVLEDPLLSKEEDIDPVVDLIKESGTKATAKKLLINDESADEEEERKAQEALIRELETLRHESRLSGKTPEELEAEMRRKLGDFLQRYGQ